MRKSRLVISNLCLTFVPELVFTFGIFTFNFNCYLFNGWQRIYHGVTHLFFLDQSSLSAASCFKASPPLALASKLFFSALAALSACSAALASASRFSRSSFC